MKINIYKIIWAFLGFLFLIGLVLAVIYLSRKSDSTGDEFFEMNMSIPEIKNQAISPEVETDLPQKENDEPIINAKSPLSPSVLRVPEEPALPPKESEITRLVIFKDHFEPKELAIKKGQPVILKVIARDEDHLFKISELGLEEEIKKDKELTISFVAPEKLQELIFFCAKPEHREAGEEGKFHIQ